MNKYEYVQTYEGFKKEFGETITEKYKERYPNITQDDINEKIDQLFSKLHCPLNLDLDINEK